VCELLGDGRQLLCSGGVFIGVRSGAVAWQHMHSINGVAFSLGSVPKTRWWANVAFSLGSVLGLLLGNIYIASSVSFGVCSGAAWQRQ
jgi:hypothetical protein